MSSSSSNPMSVKIIAKRCCFGLELMLEASEVENIILKEKNEMLKKENQKLTERLKNAELKRGDNDVKQNLKMMKDAVKKLYSVAAAVLSAIGGSDAMDDGDYGGVKDSLIVDYLCSNLQNKLEEFQGTHQKLHQKLEETLKATEELLEQYTAKQPTPPSNKDATFLSKNPSPGPRRNPLRKCRMLGNSSKGSQENPFISDQFSCDHCGIAYCRLGHLERKLKLAKERNMSIGMGLETEVKAKNESPPGAKFEPSTSTQVNGSWDQEHSAHVGMDLEIKNNPDESVTRPRIVITDSDGKEHKFAGSYKTILPSEQAKTLLEGSAPKKLLRYFCKCGRHYANWAALFYHIKFIGKNNKGIKCGLCQQDFQTGMKAHLQDAHGVEYCQGRFSCLECGEDFGTILKFQSHRQQAHFKVEVVTEDDDVRGGGGAIV